MGYMDNSGLWVPTGLEQTVPQAGGEYKTYGEDREIEFKLDLSKLTATAGTIIPGGDNIFFPKGMMIEQVEIVVESAAATGATFDIGFVGLDRTTEIDFNGLIAAETLAHMTPAGKKYTYNQGTTLAGVLVGATTTTVGYICANYTTTAFTAGVITVRIKYRRA